MQGMSSVQVIQNTLQEYNEHRLLWKRAAHHTLSVGHSCMVDTRLSGAGVTWYGDAILQTLYVCVAALQVSPNLAFNGILLTVIHAPCTGVGTLMQRRQCIGTEQSAVYIGMHLAEHSLVVGSGLAVSLH